MILAIYDPEANVGKCAEASRARSTTTGHWEIAGLPTDVPFKTYQNGFPQDFMEAYQKPSAWNVSATSGVRDRDH